MKHSDAQNHIAGRLWASENERLSAGPMKSIVRILSFGLFGLLTVSAWAMSPRPQETVPLWEALGPPAPAEPATLASEPWIILEQPILFRPAVLSQLRGDSSRPTTDVFAIKLPNNPEIEMKVTTRRPGPRGAVVVEGQLTGPRQGNLLLSIVEDAVAGTLRLGTESWSIEPRPDHRHRLVEINAEKFAPD